MAPVKPSLQVVTLGCSKNQVDTEHLLAQVQDRFVLVPEASDQPVDWLLVNTCGFIGDAKQESVEAVLAAVSRKQRGLAGKVLVMGCLSQRYADELPSLIPEVDGWYGARDLDPVVRALGGSVRSDRRTRRYVTDPSLPYAYLKISEGCDRRCSYCAIPLIRGPHRSVPMEELEEEARTLARGGVRELILIAQDTTYYGLDLYHRRALGELMQRLSAVDGIRWIRLHYSYPADFPEDVLEAMAANPKICKYLDIPLQHISDGVLDRMHRHVDGAWTRDLIGRIRARVPGIVLRTTLIVGHPGEGKRAYGELLDFVRESRFERLGAFAYSEEEGTYGAAHFRDRVPEKLKQERLSGLLTLQRGISFAYNLSRVGSEVTVLVDGVRDGRYLVTRSEYESPEVDGEIVVPYDPALMPGDPASCVGRFMKVRITQAGEYDIEGRYLNML